MTTPALPALDPVFHQAVRTRLAALLFTAEPSFTDLKAALRITDGNLDAHLKKLGAAGYLHSRMITVGRPHTVYCLSPSGAAAFRCYLAALGTILDIASKDDPGQR